MTVNYNKGQWNIVINYPENEMKIADEKSIYNVKAMFMETMSRMFDNAIKERCEELSKLDGLI